ncbi:MAG: hypothetical protein HZB18_12530 [Chloroflexi bacterium]|nr:hypothetical protein [Chloroflexota bacterium]
MKLTNTRIGIIISSLATAFLHVTLYPDIMFTLNGLGFAGLLGAYILPIPFFQERKKLVWWVLTGYTALTMSLWGVMGEKTFTLGTNSAIGYYALVVEVIMLVLLWIDKQKS